MIAGCLAAIAAGASVGQASRPGPAFESPELIAQLQEALAGIIRSALPDPKGEFAGVLAKTGFVVRLERGRQRLLVVENPHTPFLRRLAEIYGESGVADSLLRVCLRDEPERTRKLGSYTVQRVLERLEADNRDHKLAESARRNIARAVIEELVATASVDFDNQVRRTVQDYIARSGIPGEEVLGYGFSLVEEDTPRTREWELLGEDPRLFCVRFSRVGFVVFQVNEQGREARSGSSSTWRREISGLLEESNARQDLGGKKWLGLSAAP